MHTHTHRRTHLDDGGAGRNDLGAGGPLAHDALHEHERTAQFEVLLALAALGPVPGEFVSSSFAPKEMGVLLVVFLGGSLLASGLSRRSLLGAAGANAGVMRRIAAGVGESFELADGVIRRWQFASISLLMLAILFGGALVWGAPPS